MYPSKLLLCLFMFTFSIFSIWANDSIKRSTPFLLKFDALKLLPDVWGIKYGCICLGMEKHINTKNSIGLDIGYINDYGETQGTGITSIRAKKVNGLYTNIEYRNYFISLSKERLNSELYWGVNFFYQITKQEEKKQSLI